MIQPTIAPVLSDQAQLDRGDTLIEVLVAVVIIGLTATAILGSLLISINASGQHRYLANDDTLARSALEQAKQQIELPAMQSQSKFIQCSTATQSPPSSTPPTGNAQVIFAAWTSAGSYNLALPTPGSGAWSAYSGYSVGITMVKCMTATTTPSTSITPDSTCFYSSPTAGAQTGCGNDNSGLIQVGVTVKDPSGYTVTMSSIVRDPTYQSAYATNY
jgi:prepilin-type N-terminal cleavage/methylation domain-containing protein